MGDMKILTPGEKIRKIRKDFKIKQNQITGGKITRNLISLIENNKAELTDSTAKIISNCVNEICKERNIDFNMTPEDLLINNTMQAHKILDNIITEVNDHLNDTDYDFSSVIDKSEMLIKQNPNLDKIVDLYSNLGQSFLNRNDYWQAYVFYFKAYEHLNFQDQKTELPIVSIKLSYACNNLFKFSESIQIINTVLSLGMEISDLVRYKLILNKAIAQKNLKQYMNAIHSLQSLNKTTLDDVHLFNVQTLESNCYQEIDLYNDSLDIQFELLNKKCSKNSTRYLIILSNIADNYIHLKDKEKLKYYLDKALDFEKDLSEKLIDSYSYLIHYSLGIANLYIDNYDNAVMYLRQSLEESKANKYYKSEFDCLNELFSIYYKEQNYEKIEQLKTYLMELLMNDNRTEYHTLVYKYINMYSSMNKKDDLDNLVNFMINLDSPKNEK